MKRKIIISFILAALMTIALAIGVSAATTNEFADTTEQIQGIDLTGMSTDASARVVIVDANGEYHTYPAQYVVSNNESFYYNFNPINTALGTSYTKNSVVRIEVPDDVLIATKTGDLSSCKALVEIKFSPNSALHTLQYGCFYDNSKLEKLNIPASVKHITNSKGVEGSGALIINKSTLKELIFEDGFDLVLPCESFNGATGVEKVVFSNQMTTVEDRALNFTLGESLKEFYMGASLKDLGTNNMAYVKQSVKFYMPEQFLSENETITMETFSWWSSSACLPTGVIFYAGSLEQMQALIQKSTYDRVICSSANLVEWDSTKSDDEYVPANGWTIVYNYNKCKAFYGNEHEEKQLNSCQFGCARNCGVVALLENPKHQGVKSVLYGESSVVNYYADITVCEACANCKTKMGDDIKINPLFVDKGYSVDLVGSGIVYSFKADHDAIKSYKTIVDASFEYGVVASMGSAPISYQDGKVVTDVNSISANMQNEDFDFVTIKVVSIPADKLDAKIVCCGYAIENGTVYYITDKTTSQIAIAKSYNELNT